MFRKLIEILKAHPRKIVFTEGTDPRILEASARLLSGTFLTPILIGNEAEILAAAEDAGFNIRGAIIVDPENYENMEAMVARMVELRKGKMTADECRAMLKKGNYFGTMLVAMGEADALLGTLVDYFSRVDEPTILVFWGDHYNTVGKGYELYEKTGYIDHGDTKSPMLHGTPLVVWSNYHSGAVDLGTVAAYEISPVMMDLYGLEKPPFFEFLTQQLGVFRARTRGVTVNPDGGFSDTLTDEQQQWYDDHWLFQYDAMFGEDYLNQPA